MWEERKAIILVEGGVVMVEEVGIEDVEDGAEGEDGQVIAAEEVGIESNIKAETEPFTCIIFHESLCCTVEHV